MNIQQTVNLLGLVSGLLGGIFASVPMIWDAETMAIQTGNFVTRITSKLASPAPSPILVIRGEASRALIQAQQRLIVIGATLATLFIIIATYLTYIAIAGSLYDNSDLHFVGPIVGFSISIGLFIILITALFSYIIFYVIADKIFLPFLQWISSEGRDRKCGIIGLIFLFIGFIFQFYAALP